MANNLIGINSGRNFRGLGGYKTKDNRTIKYHKLIRSGHLSELDDQDLNLLANFKLKYDIDFRSEDEAKKEPDRLPSGVKYEFNPVFSEDLTNSTVGLADLMEIKDLAPDFGFNNMVDAYTDIVTGADAQNAYRTFFNYLLENDRDNEALLFHCSAGKDRTGMGAVYLLNSLGVDFDTIKKDYLISNLTTTEFKDQFINNAVANGASENLIKSINALMVVDERYLEHAIDIIDQEYGGLDQYTKDVLKVDKDEQERLQEIYLENK